MSDKAPPAPRFLVRQGSKGWMVYDRERKAPALVGTDPAVNLTKQQADQIKLTLSEDIGKLPHTRVSPNSGCCPN